MEKVRNLLENMAVWFKKEDYKGVDPFQLDQKIFSNSNVVKKRIRETLKPFHAFIPSFIFNRSSKVIISKSLGLILKGNLLNFETFEDKCFSEENEKISDLILCLKSNLFENYCWGLPFEWGSTVRYPANTPLVCVTSPIANSLFNYYEITKDNEILDKLKSVIDFYLNDNGYFEDENTFCLYYSYLDKICAINGNLMATRFITLLNCLLNDSRYEEICYKMVNFAYKYQNKDGSFPYSGREKQITTVDNRHTGFVIEELTHLKNTLDLSKYENRYKRAIEYYLNTLFDGFLPKWSPKQTYPIDIHDIAQAIITLSQVDQLDKARKLVEFAIDNMSNRKDEFYYKYFKNSKVNKTVFFRWNQAWMYLALSTYMYHKNKKA